MPARSLRICARALARTSLAARLAPKFPSRSMAAERSSLDELAADIRLRADNERRRSVSRRRRRRRGKRDTSWRGRHQRWRRGRHRLLDVIAQRGRDARARDIVAADGVAPFRSAIADLLIRNAIRCSYRAGMNGTRSVVHRLRDGSLACGIGLAFGHADAVALEQLADVARYGRRQRVSRGAGTRADDHRPVAGNVVALLLAAAEQLGFIVRADDPRRHVVACAGAPICASAHIAARALAPRSRKRPRRTRPLFTIHISGCAKGCAHPAPAALTVVGTPRAAR